ncbi:GNAT family N-acetyltransferase (plasmid) [Lichenicola cladoniae]|uniref:GNAT family N-acetyltransferase n=1 Tax=Lichenicola cladoniae TaxID=1484109 RepID=A0A6M8HY46_9PROT|nr:GNAT family N-acetyltransferase [Lichenicola cladoniae]NPD69573.1 GNAT family N-acetyltransferase [Acetobacteraceae bacterium]QKE93453.1 GNAT family N-acetyltransferase [Lichenicola cladoniae]
MDESNRTARAHTKLVRLLGQKNETHLLLINTESSLRDERLHESSAEPVTLTKAEIQLKVHYLDGPLLRETTSGSPIANFGGTIEPVWNSKTNGWCQRVRLSNGFVIIERPELRGLGLGTYLFAQIVLWAKRVAPQAWVQAIVLSSVQARDTESRNRRNKFYEKFGFEFDYRSVDGIKDAEGSSQSINISDMKVPDKIETIEVLPLINFLRENFEQMRKERSRFHSEVQRYERVVADHVALCRENNLLISLGRWLYRIRRPE